MLFWLFVIAMLIGIGIWIYGYYEESFGWGLTGTIITIISATIVLALISYILDSNIHASAKVEEYKVRYEMLTYKVESDDYRDEFGIVNKSVLDEVEYWNADLTYRKAIQKNFWVGIFYPN